MQFDAALSNMTQGLVMFDGQKRLVVWNDRFAELYQVPPGLLKVGTPYEVIVADRIARGRAKGETSELTVKTKVTAAPRSVFHQLLRLQSKSAQTALQFYRMRERANRSSA